MSESTNKIANHALYAFRNDINALQTKDLENVKHLCNYLALMTFEVDDIQIKGIKSTVSDGNGYICLTIKQMNELLDNGIIHFVEKLPKFVWKEYKKIYKKLCLQEETKRV